MERSMHVKFPVFCDYDVEVVIADDAKKARTRRNKTYGVYGKNFSALHSYTGFGNSCIVLPRKDTTLVTVAHECYHAVEAIMFWAGVEDSECFAYHIGYLTDKVYKFVRRK